MAADKATEPAVKKTEDSKKDVKDEKDEDKPIKTLSEEDVRIMQAYGAGPYSSKIKSLEAEVRQQKAQLSQNFAPASPLCQCLRSTFVGSSPCR